MLSTWCIRLSDQQPAVLHARRGPHQKYLYALLGRPHKNERVNERGKGQGQVPPGTNTSTCQKHHHHYYYSERHLRPEQCTSCLRRERESQGGRERVDIPPEGANSAHLQLPEPRKCLRLLLILLLLLHPHIQFQLPLSVQIIVAQDDVTVIRYSPGDRPYSRAPSVGWLVCLHLSVCGR